MSFSDDFMRGWRDCMAGVPSKAGESEAYLRGFGNCWQHCENMSEMNRIQEVRK